MQFGVNKHGYILFKDNKLHEPEGQVRFVVWKIYKCLLHQIAGGIMLLLVTMYIEKTSQKVKTDEILKACAKYLYFTLVLQLCTCVMTLQSCYMRMYLFSASQKHVIFLCTLLIKSFIYNTYSDSIRVKLFEWIQSTLLSFVLIEKNHLCILAFLYLFTYSTSIMPIPLNFGNDNRI